MEEFDSMLIGVLIGFLIGVLITFLVTRYYFIKASEKFHAEAEKLRKTILEVDRIVSLLKSDAKSSENKED